jgi:hypothetical protein
MFRFALILFASLPLAASLSMVARAQDAVPLFNGTSLDGWQGDPKFWKVEDGTITGQTTAETPTEGNTYLIWGQGEVDDFELTAEYKIQSGNSGIQIRSFLLPDRPWGVGGYQADIEAGELRNGSLFGENFRGMLADRGQKNVIGDDHKPRVTGQTAPEEALKGAVKQGDWNEYRIVAKGFTIQNYINGQLTAELTDEDSQMKRRGGLLALQLVPGAPMKVQFRNIKLKRLPMEGAKKIVFVAGNPSHGPGDHEHRAGSLLLARSLNESCGGKVYATVYSGGWPKDPTALANADALVMYSDGGGGHMVVPHLEEVDKFHNRGGGIGCLHYAVEIPKGPGGDYFLKWMGGYFEENWSVNPHWDADFKKFPAHPVSSGLQPFKISDEWYYHMRFRDGLTGVTPILSDVPTDATLTRADGPHEGNPAVREAVHKGEPQHMCWVSENANGSRGFGFTGAHFHKNWQNDQFRKTALNAIVWIAKGELPPEGIQSRTPTDEEMQANLDPKK